jgi:hypothetical protein
MAIFLYCLTLPAWSLNFALVSFLIFFSKLILDLNYFLLIIEQIDSFHMSIMPIMQYKNILPEPGMVARACNPNYSGGRDQED